MFSCKKEEKVKVRETHKKEEKSKWKKEQVGRCKPMEEGRQNRTDSAISWRHRTLHHV